MECFLNTAGNPTDTQVIPVIKKKRCTPVSINNDDTFQRYLLCIPAKLYGNLDI